MRHVCLYSVRIGCGEFTSKTQFCNWNNYLSRNDVELLYLLLTCLKHMHIFRVKVEPVSSNMYLNVYLCLKLKTKML